MSLQIRFAGELEVLSRLFGTVQVTSRLPRLNTVSDYAERKWSEHVKTIPGGEVKYLLIAEAPPGTDDDPPLFFLDPECRPRTLMQAVSGAFFSQFGYQSLGCRRTLAALAQRGFLMVDSIPFAMKYSSRHRSQLNYSQLVQRTARTYMREKLVSSSLSWSKQLRIAFSLRRNADCVMLGLEHELRLGGRKFRLSDDLIAVDGSNYPRAGLLRDIFRLD